MEAPERTPVAPRECEAFAAILGRIATNVSRAVQVRPQTLQELLVALTASGHVLLEDYPGVGKTALAGRWPGRSTVSPPASSAPRICSRRM